MFLRRVLGIGALDGFPAEVNAHSSDLAVLLSTTTWKSPTRVTFIILELTHLVNELCILLADGLP